jgi:hypothetical protein
MTGCPNFVPEKENRSQGYMNVQARKNCWQGRVKKVWDMFFSNRGEIIICLRIIELIGYLVQPPNPFLHSDM